MQDRRIEVIEMQEDVVLVLADAAAFTDNYDKSLRQLIEDKRKGRAPRVTASGERPSADNVVDLMQALKDSLKASGGSAADKSAAKPAAKSRASKAKAADAPAEAPAKRTARKAG